MNLFEMENISDGRQHRHSQRQRHRCSMAILTPRQEPIPMQRHAESGKYEQAINQSLFT